MRFTSVTIIFLFGSLVNSAAVPRNHTLTRKEEIGLGAGVGTAGAVGIGLGVFVKKGDLSIKKMLIHLGEVEEGLEHAAAETKVTGLGFRGRMKAWLALPKAMRSDLIRWNV